MTSHVRLSPVYGQLLDVSYCSNALMGLRVADMPCNTSLSLMCRQVLAISEQQTPHVYVCAR